MNIYCDNYASCNSVVMDKGAGTPSEAQLRAKGWHVFDGTTIGGARHKGILCAKCVDSKRRKLNPEPPLLPGQQQLFEMVVYVDEPATQ